MQELLDRYGLALVFVNVLALSLGLPVPAMPTLIVVGAGFALQVGAGAWFGCLAVLSLSVMASLMGDLAWYAAGRRYGASTLRTLCRLSLSRDSCMKKTERFYGRWGVRILMIAKFVPGLSMVSVPMAGAMRVGLSAFLRYDALGAAAWALAGVGLGVLFRGQVQRATDLLVELGSGALVLLAALLALYVGWRAWRRRALLRSLEAARIDVGELHASLQGAAAPVVLDIRAPGYRELEPYTIPGAVLADERRLGEIMAAYPPEQGIVIFCACPGEVSAAWLAARLRAHRYLDVRPLLGGLEAWRAAGYEVEKTSQTSKAECVQPG